MINQETEQVRLDFKVPSRGLFGYATEFMAQTRGYGILNHTFDSYEPVAKGMVGGRRRGVLVAREDGKATTHSILHLEDRGTIFVKPGDEVYGGMIVRSEEHTSEIQARGRLVSRRQ